LGRFFLWILVSGVGEETGWRGYALPRLQQKNEMPYLQRSYWACSGQYGIYRFFSTRLTQVLLLDGFFGLLCAAIVFTWLYNSTKGSLLAVALWHATFNYVTSSKAGAGLGAIILSILVMVWAVALIFIYKPANLSKQEKQTIA